MTQVKPAEIQRVMRFILYSMIVDAIANLPAYVESTVFSTCAPMLGRMRADAWPPRREGIR